MRKLAQISVCVFGIALSLCHSAHAQRTAYGERLISVSAHVTQFGPYSLGTEAMFGKYLLSGYWFGALGFSNRCELDSVTSESIFYPRAEVYGGYMQRVFGSRERNFNFYGGLDIFLGAEMFDLFRTLASATKQALYSVGINDYSIVYGLSPRLEMELFISHLFAVTASVRIPVCFNTNFSVSDAIKVAPGVEAGIGLRLNF